MDPRCYVPVLAHARDYSRTSATFVEGGAHAEPTLSTLRYARGVVRSPPLHLLALPYLAAAVHTIQFVRRRAVAFSARYEGDCRARQGRG